VVTITSESMPAAGGDGGNAGAAGLTGDCWDFGENAACAR
jgi:hypothetical protein